MKINRKILFTLLIFTLIILLFNGQTYAMSISLNPSKTTVSPGEKFNVVITANDATGKLYISVENGTSSESDFWIENNSKTISVTAGNTGTVKITASGELSDDQGNDDEISKSIQVSIKSSESNNSENSNSNSGSNNTNSSGNNSNTNNPTPTPAGKSNNANLSNLVITPVDFKGFKASKTTGYSVTVDNDVTEVGVKATTQDSKASYEVFGNKNLKVGENTVSIEVTAEDGKTKKTYKVIVNRKDVGETTTPTEQEPEQEPEAEPEEENSVEEALFGISEIKITGTTSDEKSVELTFTPNFSSDIYEYATIIPVEIKDINVEVKPSIENATIEVMGNKDLVVGENVITILVKSADGKEQKSYQIIVTKTTDKLKQGQKELTKKIIMIATIIIVVIAIIVIVTIYKKGNKKVNTGTIGRDINLQDEEKNGKRFK